MANDKVRVGLPRSSLQYNTRQNMLNKLGNPMYHDWGHGAPGYAPDANGDLDRYHDTNFTPTVGSLSQKTRTYLEEPSRWGRSLFFGNEPDVRTQGNDTAYQMIDMLHYLLPDNKPDVPWWRPMGPRPSIGNDVGKTWLEHFLAACHKESGGKPQNIIGKSYFVCANIYVDTISDWDRAFDWLKGWAVRAGVGNKGIIICETSLNDGTDTQGNMALINHLVSKGKNDPKLVAWYWFATRYEKGHGRYANLIDTSGNTTQLGARFNWARRYT